MDDVILRVENLGKMYHIGTVQERQTTLIGTVAAAADTAFRRIISSRSARAGTKNVEELWALRDISFELRRGEVLGIIGPNGSGKSTLLKILSRITAPTEGRIEINGHIGSLLEVGIGFHPELTGRENLYLSGAILGMKRGEIARVFDEIVDFSGVERFVDTPVKRYSSGMYVRLAFSVAVFFSPDILILDEVLAVGDAAFQKKSLEKMERIAKGGKTVLFVSHGMPNIVRICNRGLYLDQGRINCYGATNEVVSAYLRVIQNIDDDKIKCEVVHLPAYVDLRGISKRRNNWSTKEIITWVSTHHLDGTPSSEFSTGDDVCIRIGYHLDEEITAYGQINVMDYSGVRVMQLNITHNGPPLRLMNDGYLECVIHDLRLLTGKYIIMVDIYDNPIVSQIKQRDAVGDTLHIKVKLGDYVGNGGLIQGQVAFAQRSQWKVVKENTSS